MSISNDPALLVNQLPITIDLPNDPERMREFLILWMKQVANSVNTKEGGLFSKQEFFNSDQYFTADNPQTFRNVYRTTYIFSNVAGGATVTQAHNITGIVYATRIYAGCTSATPTYFSVMGQPTLYLDATNVNFTNPLGATVLTNVFVVAEYLKT